MNKSLFIIESNDTILNALRKIDCNKNGFLIVVDASETVIGVITDGDIRRILINEQPLTSLVKDCCKYDYKYLTNNDSIYNVIDLFKDEKINFVPILNSGGKLTNIITKSQLHSFLLQDIKADINFDFFTLDNSIVDYEVYPRPWGFYKTTYLGNEFQSKIISVYPDQCLSLQSHKFREEFWIVIKGNGEIQLDDKVFQLNNGDYFHIPIGCKHRLINTSSNESLIITEVQIGSYFGEDDIVRYDDKYGRK